MSVAIGARVEFYDQSGELVAAALREDIIGAAAPRIGERFGPGSLTKVAAGLFGDMPEIARVEHFPTTPGVTDATSKAKVIAVVEVKGKTLPDVKQYQNGLTAEGWQVRFLRD